VFDVLVDGLEMLMVMLGIAFAEDEDGGKGW